MSCSYCYNEGHNRRTCTVLTERLERDQASGSGYAKDALAARGKGSGSDKTNRRCSFCGTRGHDRRTCLSLGEYTTRMTDDWLAVRNAVFDKASANEFSVGSLVSFRQKDYDYESNTYIESHPVGLVEGISWGEINDGTINSRQKVPTPPPEIVRWHVEQSGSRSLLRSRNGHMTSMGSLCRSRSGERIILQRFSALAVPQLAIPATHLQRAGRLYAHISKTKIIVAIVAVSVSM